MQMDFEWTLEPALIIARHIAILIDIAHRVQGIFQLSYVAAEISDLASFSQTSVFFVE